MRPRVRLARNCDEQVEELEIVHTEIDLPQSKRAERLATLANLESRIRQEADAAARARSVEATLVHLVLATRYAERLSECSGQSGEVADQSWLEEHRLW